MTEITAENFSYAATDGKPSEKNSQVAFRRKHPELWRMIRPDRPTDHSAHRYPDKDSRIIGDQAMHAWFEYLAAKGFVKSLNAWLAMLKAGQSIMVVCDDPAVFDQKYVPPVKPILAADFWAEFERSRLAVDRRYDDPMLRDRCKELIRALAEEMRANRPAANISEPAIQQLSEWKSVPLAEMEKLANSSPPELSKDLRKLLGLAEKIEWELAKPALTQQAARDRRLAERIEKEAPDVD